MSSQKGNVSRTRPQKHKNKTAFKNDLHDKSHTIKQINSIQINHVCQHCKGVLEWKIKYKKYKQLKAASTCVICHMKTVKHAYHTLCAPCATKAKVCPKCGKAETLIMPTASSFDESILKTAEIQDNLKSMSERRRRAFNRFVAKTIAIGNEDTGMTIEEIIISKLKEMSLNSGKSTLFDELDSDFGDTDDDDGDSNIDEIC